MSPGPRQTSEDVPWLPRCLRRILTVIAIASLLALGGLSTAMASPGTGGDDSTSSEHADDNSEHAGSEHAEDSEEPTTVEAAPPTQNGDDVTIPGIDGVTYSTADGTPLAGTVTLSDGEIITIVATANEGFSLAGGPSEWTFESHTPAAQSTVIPVPEDFVSSVPACSHVTPPQIEGVEFAPETTELHDGRITVLQVTALALEGYEFDDGSTEVTFPEHAFDVVECERVDLATWEPPAEDDGSDTDTGIGTSVNAGAPSPPADDRGTDYGDREPGTDDDGSTDSGAATASGGASGGYGGISAPMGVEAQGTVLAAFTVFLLGIGALFLRRVRRHPAQSATSSCTKSDTTSSCAKSQDPGLDTRWILRLRAE